MEMRVVCQVLVTDNRRTDIHWAERFELFHAQSQSTDLVCGIQQNSSLLATKNDNKREILQVFSWPWWMDAFILPGSINRCSGSEPFIQTSILEVSRDMPEILRRWRKTVRWTIPELLTKMDHIHHVHHNGRNVFLYIIFRPTGFEKMDIAEWNTYTIYHTVHGDGKMNSHNLASVS